MTLSEKVAYIKGLAEGLKLDESKDEVKVINAIVDVLEEMANGISTVADTVDDAVYQLDEVDECLSELESYVYDDDAFDDDDDDCSCADCCDDEDENVFYEVTCPTCGKDINVEEDVLLCGETKCPNCGEILEFDFSSLCDEDEDGVCGCGCDDCSDDNHNACDCE